MKYKNTTKCKFIYFQFHFIEKQKDLGLLVNRFCSTLKVYYEEDILQEVMKYISLLTYNPQNASITKFTIAYFLVFIRNQRFKRLRILNKCVWKVGKESKIFIVPG